MWFNTDLMTNWAEFIFSPQLLLDKIPPFPTTAHDSNVAFPKGCSYKHTHAQNNEMTNKHTINASTQTYP